MPTAGFVRVSGLDPLAERSKLAYLIGAVWGQRSSLIYNLPIVDSFELHGKLYDLSDEICKERMKRLFEQFDLVDIAGQPVRKLSLGQRMRAEVALSVLHDPKILFLDEPTIGLDVVAKKKLREMLLKMNEENGTTIILTSHDSGDIEALCKRIVMINHGEIVVDASTNEVTSHYFNEKYVNLKFKDEVLVSMEELGLQGGEVVVNKPGKLKLKVDVQKNSLNDVLKTILANYPVLDVDVHGVGVESVIEKMFKRKK